MSRIYHLVYVFIGFRRLLLQRFSASGHDEDALIFRLLETAGKDTQANVVLDKALLGTVASADEVDLLERPIDSSSAKSTKDGFRVSVPAHGITSVNVAFCP